MSDDSMFGEFESEGIFGGSDIEVSDLPSDPFGFGNEYWPVEVIEVGKPKVTNKGDRIGMMVQWQCIHPDHIDTKLGFGNWMQLPVPRSMQGEIPWDPKSQEGRQVKFRLGKLFEALGFSKDEMSALGPNELKGRRCLAKIRVRENDEGFWQFNIMNHKRLPEDTDPDEGGFGEFASNSNSSKSSKDLLEDEMNS